MTKGLLLLALLTFVTAEDEEQLTVEQKLSKVVLPQLSNDLRQSVHTEDCLDKKEYADTERLKEVTTESRYLCSFIAFQANKKEGVGLPRYSSHEKSTEKFKLFKKCVDEVNRVNSDPENTYTAGVNFFCDMTDDERKKYLAFPNGLGSRRGLGSSGGRGSAALNEDGYEGNMRSAQSLRL